MNHIYAVYRYVYAVYHEYEEEYGYCGPNGGKL
jgi:hypothetical protein